MLPLSRAFYLDGNDLIILPIDDRDIYLLLGKATMHRTQR